MMGSGGLAQRKDEMTDQQIHILQALDSIRKDTAKQFKTAIEHEDWSKVSTTSCYLNGINVAIEIVKRCNE